MNQTKLKTLAHNCLIHPIAGILWLVGSDALDAPAWRQRASELADRVHETFAPDGSPTIPQYLFVSDNVIKLYNERFTNGRAN